MVIADAERARRLEAAQRYIDTSEHGWLFAKDDLRLSTKTFYFVPFEYQHKVVNELPDEILRIMAFQGHRRRSGKEEGSATNMMEERGEEVQAGPSTAAPPSSPAASGVEPTGPGKLKKSVPKTYEEMFGKMNDAFTTAVQQIITFGNKSHEAIQQEGRATEDGLKRELATAKRRIAELEQEASMFQQIAEIVKKNRTT